MPSCWRPRRPLLVALTTGLLALGPVGTLAQINSTVVCLSSFSWMDNSENQNPCEVAAYLQGACNGGEWTITPLPPNTHYIGPSASESNPCQCSSVTYSALSACGACQGNQFVAWSAWGTNCTGVYLENYPQGIPAGTAVPAWAFQNVTIGNAFNVSLAQLIGDTPEATPTNSQTTIVSSSTSTSSATTISSPTDSPTAAASSASSSNTGAIAGGVIGGVVGVALIGAAVIFMMRKKRSQRPPLAESTGVGVLGSPDPSSAGFPDSTFFSPQMVQPRLYNPSDPSTFPPSPPPATLTSGSSHFQNPALSYSSPSMRPGGYSGAPEV